MANISSALVQVVFRDEEGSSLDIELTENESVTKAITALSYDCEGMACSGNIFNMSGRWHFSNNFNWDIEREALIQAVRDNYPQVYFVDFTYTDVEVGCEFLAYGKVTLDIDNESFIDELFVDTSYELFAKAINLPKPLVADEGNPTDEEAEKISEWMTTIEDTFTERYMY